MKKPNLSFQGDAPKAACPITQTLGVYKRFDRDTEELFLGLPCGSHRHRRSFHEPN